MAKLSPAAQAILNAFRAQRGLAAVLRVAADQVAPQCEQPLYADDFAHGAWFARDDVRDDLLRIANEIESQ